MMNPDNFIFQYSTINALANGIFDGQISIDEIRKYGRYGIGTINGLDGEVIVIDGHFYHISSTGKIEELDNDVRVPFAIISNLVSPSNFDFNEIRDLRDFGNMLLMQQPQNNFIMIVAHGDFNYIKTRSLPKQKMPYSRLIDIIDQQSIFEVNNIKGHLIGFYFPSWMGDISVSGFHFHFLSDDKKMGGHVLKCGIKNICVNYNIKSNFQLILPDTVEYRTARLTIDRNDIVTIENDQE